MAMLRAEVAGKVLEACRAEGLNTGPGRALAGFELT